MAERNIGSGSRASFCCSSVMTSRISRPNRDTLHYEATITDPGAYSEPWTVAWDIPWLEGAELAEYICQENNKFLLELKDDFGNPFFEDIPTEKP